MLLTFPLLLSLLSIAWSHLDPQDGPVVSILQEDFLENGAQELAIFLFPDQSDNLERSRRDAGSGGSGEEIVDVSNCTYTLTVSPFTPFSSYLDSSLLRCTKETDLDEQRYNYTVTISSSLSITTYTTHTSLFPADHFKLKDGATTHKINVTANCSSGVTCDYASLTLYLSLVLSSDYTSRLLPFGDSLSDESLTGVDDSYVTVVVNGNKPVPIFDEKYRKFYISSNGLVSLTRPYLNWQAVPFPYGQTQVPILAPFWTDLDLRTSTNTSFLYHNIYTSTDGIRARNMLRIASDRVQTLTGKEFDGTWALVSTWFNTKPYLGTDRETTSNCTFQLVLLSNYSTTYLLYLYDQTTLGSSHSSSVAVGYTAGDFVTYYNEDDLGSSPQLSTAVGNTGTVGQWAFKVNSNVTNNEDENECLKWVQEQLDISNLWISNLPSCPCTLLQARNDWRFSFTSSARTNCAVFVTTATRHGLECCYDEVGGTLRVGPNDGGCYHYYHSLFYPSEHEISDSTPYSKCCDGGTEGNCELFYRYRPSSNCSRYEPPTPGFLWGDPHFETPDSRNYTFNGVGEYQLLLSPTNRLNVQIRLSKLTGTSATVITALAIKSYDAQLVQLEINSIGSFVLYVGNNEHLNLPDEGEFLVVTETSSHAHNDLSSVDPTHLSNIYLLNINNTMVISVGGAVFTVGKQLSFMYVGVELGREFLDATEGLLGYYDSEPANDFLLPNGTMLLEEMSEEEIYYNFGLQWQVSESDSIFHYHSQYTYSTYNMLITPSFGLSALQSNSTLFAIATTNCDGDYSCLYDIGQTGSLSFGLGTHSIRNTNRKMRKDLVNFPPNITGPRQVTVTVNSSDLTVVQYTAVDPDDDTDTMVTLKDPVPSGISINSTGHMTFNLTSLPSSPLYVTSNDTTNTTTVSSLSILLCDCKNNGTCITSDNYPLNSGRHYRLMCECLNGFGGLYCEEDLRVCGYDPCPTYSECVSISGGGYRCTDCADGYTDNSEMKCVDINECSSVSTNNCSQICTNSVGSYRCSCRDGYRLSQDDKTSCIDIDECAEGIDDCDQYCTNTQGSYTCSCRDLWDSSGSSCVEQAGAEPCAPMSLCDFLSMRDHTVECTVHAGSAIQSNCYCEDGYHFGTTCQECTGGSYGFECSKTCSCSNGGTCNPSTGCVCTSEWSGYNCETDINPNYPSFAAGTTSSLSLPKLLPRDTPIMYISASDPDGGHVTYHLIKSPHVLPSNTSDGIGVFRINETTGLLETSRDLSPLSFTHFLLHVRVSDGGHTPKNSTHLIAVELTTDPLPSPLLTSPSQSLTITENKPNSTEVYTVNCTEKDSINSAFTTLDISIISGNTNNTFRINGNRLVTNRSIDYEVFQSFSLVFSCKNAFNLTDTISETILVLNLNDNPFVFSTNSYSVRVYENVTNGYELVTVSASDADVANATIRYTLTDVNHFGGLFSVNATSGLVAVNSSVSSMPFDRETRDEYIFNITATLHDNDDDVLVIETTQATINLTLLDVNDFIPLFSSSLYLSTNLSQSNSYPDTVLYVSARDDDLSSNAHLTYSIEVNTHFDINPILGEIYVKTANISKGNYLLQVNATDNGTTPLTGTSSVDIYVRPTPEELLFNKHHYYFTFPESIGPGSTVGTIHAILYDIFNVSITEGSAIEAIEYRIVDGASGSFYVSSTGHVITTALLDYESMSYYYLQVVASLADFTGVSMAMTRVHLTLQDVNDNAPRFQPSSYSTVIYEDEQIGTSILTVYASDRDDNGHQSVLYSIEEEFDGPFSVNSTNGDISISRSLTPHDYHFQVLATDQGATPSLTSTATVYISIARRHTVRPVLNSTLYIFSIPEGFNSVTSIVGYIGAIKEGNISVSSSDGLGFRLKPPGYDMTTPFLINTLTGDLTLSLPLVTFDYEQQEQFILYVELYHISTNETLDLSPIVVKVTDVNDNFPIFSRSYYSAVIPLTTPPNTPVAMVTALDADSELNSELIYSLDSPVIGFHIERGVVTVTNSTLRSGDYHMTVTASDRGAPPKNTSVSLVVTILPLSSKVIIFSMDNYQFELPENSLIGTPIGQVRVTNVINQTFGINDITYSLKVPHDCFSINPLNGTLSLTCTNLDRENQSNYGLVVVAMNGGVRAEVGITVTVGNVNDHAPILDRSVYTSIIYANYSNVSTNLIQPHVTDEDGNESTAIFSLSPSSDFIAIERRTGQIYIHESYLNESLPLGDYRFIVTAVDSGNFALNDTAIFLLTIIERAPKILTFSSSSLEFSVPENSPGGTPIGIIELLTPQPVNPEEFLGNLHFEILSGDNPDYFHVFDSNTTLFLVNNLLDRETSDTHVILVRASFLQYHVSVSAYITIIVMDENDNAPRFNQSIYVSSLQSDASLGTYVISIYADDKDIGLNEIISYSLDNSTSYFELDANTGVVSTLTTPIPEAHYKLIVNAIDSGLPRLTSTSVISVTVEIPIPDTISFKNSTYDFFVLENSLVGTQIGSVSIAQESAALDELIYSFVTPADSNLASNLNNFHLDPLSGNITTLASIDREVFSGGVVNIKAHLPSLPTLSAIVQVTLNIGDINDNYPIFGSSVYTGSITEGSINTGNTILTVSATDADYGTNADIIFTITGSDFTIGQTTGVIKPSNEDLTSGVHSLTVTARDEGSPSLTGTTQLIITVYAPVPSGIAFTKAPTLTQYKDEDTPIGSICALVQLNTIDLTYVSDIQYTLSSNDNFVVTKLSQTQAAVRNTVSFDYETLNRYELTVTATVHLTGAAISTATATIDVIVRVKDVNDNAPIFQNVPASGHYSASVNENTGSGFNIIKLTASDADSGNNGKITYSLESNFTDRFSIDSNGNLKTGNVAIDRETNSHFTVIVNATDGGSPTLYSTAHVIVTVNDLNDNPPVLVSDNNFNYYIKEEQKPSTVLFTAIANDVDSSSTLQYSIIGGTGMNTFTIDPQSGKVRSTVQLDLDQGPSSYTLNIQVSDGSHATSQIFNINLQDVPYDNRPVFIDFPTSIRISSHIQSGTNITVIRAVDPDNNDLTYSLMTDNNFFTINPTTGVLQRSSHNPLLPGSQLDVSIKVTDDSPYTLSTIDTCVISVLQDLEFVDTSYTFSISESVPIGTIVGFLNISDPDLIPDSVIVESDRARTYFDFPAPTHPGQVAIATGSKLDYEDPSQRVEFTFRITLELLGHTSQSALVTINILDANDNSPVFVGGADIFVITESDYTIGRVNATDADSGSNSVITYSIETTSLFTIDSNTGIIRRAQLLTTGVETITVIATDHGLPPQNTTKVFTVHITGVSSTGGTSGVVPYILVVIVTVICVGLIIALCVLSVLLTRKRRERVKKKNRDPYLDKNINENWKLSASKNDWKSKNFEMEDKNNIDNRSVDDDNTSAYHTMYERHLLDIDQMPWANNPGYRDNEFNNETDLPTDDGSSDFTASVSTDLRHSTEQVLPPERRLSLAGSQKDVYGGGGGERGPISRRGRRASGDDSNNSDLDTQEYLQKYQDTNVLSPGERPPEYEIFLKPDPSKPPPGTRPSLRNALWPHGPNQVNLPLPKQLSTTQI